MLISYGKTRTRVSGQPQIFINYISVLRHSQPSNKFQVNFTLSCALTLATALNSIGSSASVFFNLSEEGNGHFLRVRSLLAVTANAPIDAPEMAYRVFFRDKATAPIASVCPEAMATCLHQRLHGIFG